MSYGPSIREVYRRVVALMDKILKGAKPTDLPVEQVMRFEFVINLKTATALGITFSPSQLVFADEVIQ
jgi:putative tryptophan/tyrosine transport system substrate-binding protein